MLDIGGESAAFDRALDAVQGLHPPALSTAGVIGFEPTALEAVVTGWHRASAALAVGLFTFTASALALLFRTLLRGDARTGMTNVFFDDRGLTEFIQFAALSKELVEQ